MRERGRVRVRERTGNDRERNSKRVGWEGEREEEREGGRERVVERGTTRESEEREKYTSIATIVTSQVTSCMVARLTCHLPILNNSTAPDPLAIIPENKEERRNTSQHQ